MRHLLAVCFGFVLLTGNLWAEVRCPDPVPDDVTCVPASETMAPGSDWQPTAVLIMEDNSTLRLDPSLSSQWLLDFDRVVFGSGTVVDLSGADADGVPAAGMPQAKASGSCINGTAGIDGATGLAGQDAAKLVLTVDELETHGVVFKRFGGDGGRGGEGGRGGDGSMTNCDCGDSGSGGLGGRGGQGGDGGGTGIVSISYGRVTEDVDHDEIRRDLELVPVVRETAVDGVFDAPLPGRGGDPGLGGFGGKNGGENCHCWDLAIRTMKCEGGGRDFSNQRRAEDLGRGRDGTLRSFEIKGR
jgi:hypothetical protein